MRKSDGNFGGRQDSSTISRKATKKCLERGRVKKPMGLVERKAENPVKPRLVDRIDSFFKKLVDAKKGDVLKGKLPNLKGRQGGGATF